LFEIEIRTTENRSQVFQSEIGKHKIKEPIDEQLLER